MIYSILLEAIITWANAAAAVGPGGGWEVTTDYTKPQQIVQNPDRLYNIPTDKTKTHNDYTKLPKDLTKA